MLAIATFIIGLPFIFIIFENLDAGKYKKQKNIKKSQEEIDTIEDLFMSVQQALDTQNIELLKKHFSAKLIKYYNKKFEKLYIQDKKIYIKNPKLEGITRLRNSKNGFSVTLSFKAISYTLFNKERVEIYWNMIDYCFTPTGEGIEGSTTNYIHFKERWWFSYEDNDLKVTKIKKFYTKNK